MSLEIFFEEGVSLPPKGISISSESLKHSAELCISGAPVAHDWTPELKHRWDKSLRKLSYPYRHATLTELPFDERATLRRFLISLDAYIESSNPVQTEKFLLHGCTELDFAKTLKRIRTKSFLISTRATTFAEEEWWNEVPGYHIKDIGDVFNYRYLPLFKEEVTDYKWGDVPVKIKPKYAKQYKMVLRDLLEGAVEPEPIDPLEIILSSSGSSCISGKGGKTKPVYLEKQLPQKFSEFRGESKRCVVYKDPGAPRDAVMNSLSDLNTIRLIERQTDVVLNDNFKKFLVDKQPETWKKKYSKFQSDFDYFLCRDLRKEGITKPRELLKITLKELHRRFPTLEAFKYVNFYENFVLILEDGIKFYPKRGHGLGMANALTTLMQIVVFYMIRARFPHEPKSLGMLTLNDDLILGFESYDDLETFWSLEDDVLNGLSLLRVPEKSFHGWRCGVFVEEYFATRIDIRTINSKESYRRRSALIALGAVNIVHAKSITSSINFDDDMIPYLSEIVAFWGYEFFENEASYPSMFGGWLSYSVFGMSLDLKRLEELDYNKYVCKAYFACKHKKAITPTRKGLYLSPVEVLNKATRRMIPQELWNKFDIGVLNDVVSKYERLKTSPKKFQKAWNKLYKSRQDAYRNAPVMPLNQLAIDIMSNADRDYYPLDFMIEKHIILGSTKDDIPDIFGTVNPMTSYLHSLKIVDRGLMPNPFSIWTMGRDSTRQLSHDEKQRALTFIGSNMSSLFEFEFDLNFIPTSENWEVGMNSYLFPLKAWKVFGELECNRCPILYEKYRSPIIKHRMDIYSIIPPMEHLDSLKTWFYRRAYQALAKIGTPISQLEELTEKLIHKLTYVPPPPEIIIAPIAVEEPKKVVTVENIVETERKDILPDPSMDIYNNYLEYFEIDSYTNRFLSALHNAESRADLQSDSTSFDYIAEDLETPYAERFMEFLPEAFRSEAEPWITMLISSAEQLTQDEEVPDFDFDLDM